MNAVAASGAAAFGMDFIGPIAYCSSDNGLFPSMVGMSGLHPDRIADS